MTMTTTDFGAPEERPDYIATLYIWAEDGTYSHSEEVDLRGPLPRRSTPTPPPEVQGALIPQWAGSGWVLAERPVPHEPGVPASAVDTERDRRIDAGFEFEGVRYQSRPGDRENIAGKSLEAFMAIVSGAQPGDLRWSNPERDFAWIAADNSLVPMDAQTVMAFGKAASAHKETHVFAARQLKEMQPIPQDYTDDQWWP